MHTSKDTLAAVVLGNLIKRHVAQEIVSLSGTSDCALGEGARVCVYGQNRAELLENRARCYDAAKVFGVGLLNRKLARSGATIEAVAFENDPFNQIKHYRAELTVTYL